MHHGMSSFMTCFSEVMRLTTSVSPETVTIITQNTASSPPRKFNLIVVCGVVASRVTVWDVTETVLLCQQLNIEKICDNVNNPFASHRL